MRGGPVMLWKFYAVKRPEPAYDLWDKFFVILGLGLLAMAGAAIVELVR